MKLIKSVLACATAFALSTAAQAATVSFTAGSITQIRTAGGVAGPVGDTLAGSGTLNGGSTTFFGHSSIFVTFDGYVSTAAAFNPSLTGGTTNFEEVFSGGSISVFNSTMSTELLRLQPRALGPSEVNTLRVLGFFNTNTGGTATGDQFLDVIGGSLATMFNPDTATADLQVTTTFQLGKCDPSLPTGLTSTQTCTDGSFQVTGQTLDIPEPGSLALAGLGLLGLASIRRRKSQSQR